MLGISHDAGYTSFLDELLRDESVARMVTILEGGSIVPELVRTDVGITQLREIFRQERILYNVENISNYFHSLSHSADASRSQSPSTILSRNTGTPTWAGVTSTPTSSTPPQTPAAASRSFTSSTWWNPGPRGLDEPINVDPVVYERVKRRTGSDKLCNNHFLRGPCVRKDCTFQHHHKCTEKELEAIAVITRLNPCANGQDCTQNTCIYGHHCPSVISGVCSQFNCRFDEDAHPPGTIIKHPKKYE
jgi:hypothetical protein